MKKIIPHPILEILSTLNPFPSYLVGGCVRDFLLGISPKDWDICTQATPAQIGEKFPNSLDLGAKYGTIGIKSSLGVVEITTFRTEQNYKNFRHPQVCFSKDLHEDLARRDFSINAIAYSPSDGFIDPFLGMEDIRKKRLRCIGKAQDRFSEDALRILRLVRFASKLDFQPDSETLKGALECIALLAHISKERIRDELLKIFQTPFWHKYFNLFQPIYSAILPELKKPFKHKISNTSILFAYIFQSQNDLKALERLKIEKTTSWRTQILFHHKRINLEADKVAIKLLLHQMGYDNLNALLELQKLMGKDIRCVYKILQNIMIADECFLLKDLKLNGHDLIDKGYKKEEIGRKLNELLIRVIKEEIPNKKSSLLDYC